MRELSPAEAAALGVRHTNTLMDNGEFRHRLMYDGIGSGSGYILTRMPADQRGWQNSHYHRGVLETFIVQRGWIGFADLVPGGEAALYVYRTSTPFTSRAGHPHNVYMPAGAIIHTVKHGDCSLKDDWVASPELDLLTKSVTEEQLFRRAGLSDAEINEIRALAA